MCLPQRSSANMTAHRTKQRGSSSLVTTLAIVVVFCVRQNTKCGLKLVGISGGNLMSRLVEPYRSSSSTY